MPDASTAGLVVALHDVAGRGDAAARLAARLGVRELLLLVRDPALDVLLPAPGFPRTLRGGATWRAFVARCREPGLHEDDVEFPLGTRQRARAIVSDGVALVLIGGPPDAGELAVVESLLPLLSATLRAEQQAELDRAKADFASHASERARTLASSLEATRAETAKLNAELRGEQRRKDDFLAMLAHELRNPLTPLVTAIELLRRQRGEPGGIDRQIDIMSRQVRQLTRLVEDLLDVSRVSRGRIDLRRHPVPLKDVIADAVEAARPVLDARGHRITVALPSEALTLNADNVRLTQVFSNLLNNAAKYTDPAGRIDVSAAREGDQVVVRLKDNGIGIAPEMLPRVFDLFAQAPVSLARAQGGLGVGLTLVRALVELHGGEVAAESEGLGRGSTFTVRLPLASAQAIASPAPQAPSEAALPPALRVLVVDDNQDAADSMGDLWRLMGHHAEVAYSGIAALQIAADLDPDLVLLDIGLPEIDGYEVARRMRRVLSRSVRFVALTGYGTEEDMRRSRDAGFDEHVVKPVDPAALRGIAERAGARAHAAG